MRVKFNLAKNASRPWQHFVGDKQHVLSQFSVPQKGDVTYLKIQGLKHHKNLHFRKETSKLGNFFYMSWDSHVDIRGFTKYPPPLHRFFAPSKGQSLFYSLARIWFSCRKRKIYFHFTEDSLILLHSGISNIAHVAKRGNFAEIVTFSKIFPKNVFLSDYVVLGNQKYFFTTWDSNSRRRATKGR